MAQSYRSIEAHVERGGGAQLSKRGKSNMQKAELFFACLTRGRILWRKIKICPELTGKICTFNFVPAYKQLDKHLFKNFKTLSACKKRWFNFVCLQNNHLVT
jgi:hypothetical protein